MLTGRSCDAGAATLTCRLGWRLVTRQRKPLKIYRDEVKERATTHWDLDCLPRAEFETAMSAVRFAEHPSQVVGSSSPNRFVGVFMRLLNAGLSRRKLDRRRIRRPSTTGKT